MTILYDKQILPKSIFVIIVFVLVSIYGIVARHHHEDGDICFNIDDPNKCYEQQYGKNANLFHTVGKIFQKEKKRQQRENHNTADAGENGPKELSLYCPSDPQVRILDLDETERDRDICLVLNIAAPEITSRLVIFCNYDNIFSDSDTSNLSRESTTSCVDDDDPKKCKTKNGSKKTNLYHTIGKIFKKEKQEERRENHNTADAVENGPKQISLYCPSEPQVRIVDLDEAERERDICLVLNIASPEVNSRMVLFCNSESDFASARNSTESEDT